MTVLSAKYTMPLNISLKYNQKKKAFAGFTFIFDMERVLLQPAKK